MASTGDASGNLSFITTCQTVIPEGGIDADASSSDTGDADVSSPHNSDADASFVEADNTGSICGSDCISALDGPCFMCGTLYVTSENKCRPRKDAGGRCTLAGLQSDDPRTRRGRVRHLVVVQSRV